VETKSILFASLKQRFLQLKECHTLHGSAQEGANAALLNPNPLVTEG
jgi:hypothetical protein